ncbi:MAG: site-specific DNA-methyltransferase, partial [Pseudoleptotrichia goodfellowii]|nr:site-specific DNA-methyltransferase [Pseudoleptotrichia goodfellowii]
QLDVIARGIELWTNENDIVLDPFAGIGSTNYVALKMGRRTIGVELKENYYNIAVENTDNAALDYVLYGNQAEF